MSDLRSARLVLFFTRGVSLRTWDEIGMFEREVALYRRLRPHLRGITFVTYGDMRDARYADRLDGIGVICNRLKVPGRRWFLPQRFYVPLLSGLSPILFRGHTVIKSNQVRGADIALRAARLSGAKFIARCGYMWSMLAKNRTVGKQESEIKRATTQERRAFDCADCVVVTTERMKQYVVTQYGLSSGKVWVIPNYVLTEQFRPLPDSRRNKRRICFVGRLSHEKNLLGLLEAIKGLDVELLMIGDGPLREELEDRARRNGLAVRFLGNRPHHELPQYLNSAALFVLPSPHEGHPKTLLEAMSCGLPVVGTDVPGIQDVIVHRQTGFLCGTSPSEIRKAILEVLNDEELAARMRRQAREFIVEHFSLDRVVDMELNLLRSLVESS